jgi:hypothetical protein
MAEATNEQDERRSCERREFARLGVSAVDPDHAARSSEATARHGTGDGSARVCCESCSGRDEGELEHREFAYLRRSRSTERIPRCPQAQRRRRWNRMEEGRGSPEGVGTGDLASFRLTRPQRSRERTHYRS